MVSFDRDPAQERRQILEISTNVARRLLDVLERSRYAHPATKAEINEAVTVITGIQRDVDQIVTGMPGEEALDVAILTHILGGQQHALERLEDLELKLRGGPKLPAPIDPAHTHAALIATAREIEREALRYGTVYSPQPEPSPHGAASHRPSPSRTPAGPAASSSRAAQRPRATKPARSSNWAARLPGVDIGTILAVPRARASLGIVAVAGLAVAAWALVPARQRPEPIAAVDAPEVVAAPRTEGTTPFNIANAAAIGPRMEQPYLVVLSTRRSTEELQQDYRTFKQSYADLLVGTKARVDRIQGQDKLTYYRLSLIPPQSRDDAKTLCGRLRSSGLTGCWIRQVPVN